MPWRHPPRVTRPSSGAACESSTRRRRQDRLNASLLWLRANLWADGQTGPGCFASTRPPSVLGSLAVASPPHLAACDADNWSPHSPQEFEKRPPPANVTKHVSPGQTAFPSTVTSVSSRENHPRPAGQPVRTTPLTLRKPITGELAVRHWSACTGDISPEVSAWPLPRQRHRPPGYVRCQASAAPDDPGDQPRRSSMTEISSVCVLMTSSATDRAGSKMPSSCSDCAISMAPS